MLLLTVCVRPVWNGRGVFSRGGARVSHGVRTSFDMPDEERDLFFARSLKYLQETIRRSGPAAAASYTLVGGIVLLGGIGYALDRWQNTAPWFLVSGLLTGLIIGFYELAKTVWRR